MCCCDNNNDHSERVITYWEEFLKNGERTVSGMADYFRITEEEATEILNNHTELKF